MKPTNFFFKFGNDNKAAEVFVDDEDVYSTTSQKLRESLPSFQYFRRQTSQIISKTIEHEHFAKNEFYRPELVI